MGGLANGDGVLTIGGHKGADGDITAIEDADVVTNADPVLGEGLDVVADRDRIFTDRFGPINAGIDGNAIIAGR